MNLTYIANIRFPTERAHGIQIMSMAEAFAKAGAYVTLLVSDRRTSITDEPFYYYGVQKLFAIERLKTFDLTHYGHIFRSLAYHIERITFTRSALAFAKSHKDHIFYTRDELTFMRFQKKRIPVVFEMHTLPQRMYLYKSALQNSKKIVVITKHLKDALVTHGIDQNKIIVAPDGVNLDTFGRLIEKKEARMRLGLDEKIYVALYVGLFDEWKGYRTLIEASQKLAASGVKCVLVGGSDAQVAVLAREFPNIEFRSFIPYAELPLVQQAADVLVIPNSARFDISRLYTSPLKLFAHMTSGIPMVVADLPSLREVVDEESAVFFTPDNSDSLAQTILQVKDNPYKMKLISEHAKERVQLYSWLNRAKNILEAIAK